MVTKSGFHIVRLADLPWEDRVNVDGWPSRGGMYYTDPDTTLCLRLIDYFKGAIEPRQVHPGSHAATVLKNTVIVDGQTLEPLDIIHGPSGEPHGPLHYPDGCNLFSAFLGSYHHSEVQEMAPEKRYRLIEAAKIPWETDATDGHEIKTLVDHGLGPLLEQVVRYPARAKVAAHSYPKFQSALVIEGSAVIDDQKLGIWDLFYVLPGVARGDVSFPEGATLLMVTMR